MPEQRGPLPPRPSRRRRALLVLALTSIACQGLAQTDEEQTREQLRQLEVDISNITSRITEASGRHDELQKQLQQAEVEQGRLQREIGDNRQALENAKAELAQLEERRTTLEQGRDRQQARIAQELKTAWQIGRQGQAKVVLNQEDPHTLARSLAYYRYFFRARNTLVEQYRETLRELDEVQQRIDDTQVELASRGETLLLQQSELASAQQDRTLAMRELSATISSSSEQLQRMEQDRKRLEAVLRAIEEAVVDLQVPADYASFHSAKSRMPWPVEGKPSNQFGRPRNEAKMRWQGVMIPAAAGTTVRAIHHGRVVYSDWLRGSGLLLIIDHGDGYMSLYAHNESLLREVGEWVSAGTPVSTVGNSGGEQQAALYFEIRHNGEPVDPVQWCKG